MQLGGESKLCRNSEFLQASLSVPGRSEHGNRWTRDSTSPFLHLKLLTAFLVFTKRICSRACACAASLRHCLEAPKVIREGSWSDLHCRHVAVYGCLCVLFLQSRRCQKDACFTAYAVSAVSRECHANVILMLRECHAHVKPHASANKCHCGAITGPEGMFLKFISYQVHYVNKKKNITAYPRGRRERNRNRNRTRHRATSHHITHHTCTSLSFHLRLCS